MNEKLICGKWYVFDFNPAKDLGNAGLSHGIGLAGGKTNTDYPVSPPFDSEEEAEQWLAQHPEHGIYVKVMQAP